MNVLTELKRRNVIRMAGLYLVAAWLVVQVAATLLPVFVAPAWTMKVLVSALAIGFLPVMVFAWVFELTPGGIKRDAEVPREQSIGSQVGRRMERMIVVLLVLALGYFGFDKFVLAPGREAAIAAQSAQAVRKAASAAVLEKSIAVLPLVNAGPPDQQFFSDGLSESLIIALAQFDGLQVIGRNSAFQFRDSKESSKAIGAKLGVAHLLEGSVQHAGDAVRISVELVNAATGRALWSQRYDRPYTELFKLQDEITQSVAAALKTKLLSKSRAAAQSDRPPGGNLAAYDAYLQGNFYAARSNDGDGRKTIDAYTLATRLDPQYALAWARLSIALTGLASSSLSGATAQQAYAQARNAIDRALLLAPDLATAHVARGALLQRADFNWTGAEAAYRRAVSLAPNDGQALRRLGELQATLGQIEPAVVLARRAVASEPLRADWRYGLSLYLSALGRVDEAEQALRRAIELQPAADAYHLQLAVIAIQRGDAKAALAAARQEQAGDGWQDIALAQAQQLSGDPAAADAALKTLIDKQSELAAYQIAQVYALRREPDKVFEWLDRAWELRDPGIAYLLFDPFILRYRDDPRFAAYTRKVGLPTTTDAKVLP